MKNFALLIIILISSFVYTLNGQNSNSKKEKFSYNNKGLEPKDVLFTVEGMKKEDMLAKAKEWIKEKYGDSKKNNAKATNIEDDNGDEEKGKKSKKLNLKGFTDNAICFNENGKINCEGLTYTIELKFYDGEYKFKPKKLSYRTPASKKKKNIQLEKSDFHSPNGNISTNYKDVPSQIETLFNNLNKSLLNYLTGKPQEDEW